MQCSGKEERVCVYCALPGEKEFWKFFYESEKGVLKPVREYRCPRCRGSFWVEPAEEGV